jgi:The Golgi pH Regulator (GPHR) Family N-terminal
MDILFLAVSGVFTTYIPRQCLDLRTATLPSSSSNSNPTMALDDTKKNIPTTSSLAYSVFGQNNSNSITKNSHSLLFTISLGLSLLLFTFNLLELFPQSWLLWIVTSNNAAARAAAISITDLYRIILWMITIHCMIIIPAGMGIAVMMMIFSRNYSNSDNTNEVRIDKNSKNDNKDDDADDRKKRNFYKRPASDQRKRRHWAVRIFIYTLSTGTNIFISALLSYVLYPLLRTIQYYIVIPVIHKFRWCFHCRYSFLPTTTTLASSQYRTNHLFIIRCWYDSRLRKCILYGTILGIFVSALFLRSIYPLVFEPSHHQEQGNNIDSNVLLHCIKSLCAVGVIISTILNGFGSISLPYTCVAGLFVEPIPHDVIRNAEVELEQIKVNLNNKVLDFTTLSNDTMTVPLGSVNSSSGSHSASPPKASSSFWITTQKKRGIRRNFSDFTSDATLQQRQKATSLSTEIEFLETLIDDMTNNVDEMRYAQSISYDARTTFGRLRSYMGIFFSILLLSRLMAAFTNVGNHYFTARGILPSFWRHQPTASITPRTNIDLVTQIVLWISGRNVATTESLHTISQCISLSLTAMLSISQMRVFLRTITNMQRRMNNLYRKCYCQPLRFGCNDRTNIHHRRRKMKLSTSFTDATIASYMSLQSNQSPNSSSDSSIPGNRNHDGSSSISPDDNIWFLSHPISFFLCCYCLACVVLTKMMLPLEYRTNFSNALLFLTSSNNHHTVMTNTIFAIRTYTIDVLYSITALVSGTILAITLSFMRSNVRRIQLYSRNNYSDSGSIRSPSFHSALPNRSMEGA